MIQSLINQLWNKEHSNSEDYGKDTRFFKNLICIKLMICYMLFQYAFPVLSFRQNLKNHYKKPMALEDKHSFLPDIWLTNILMSFFFFSVAVCKVTMRYGPGVTPSWVSLFSLYMMTFLMNTKWAIKWGHRFQKTAVVTKSMKEPRQAILIGRWDHFYSVFEFRDNFSAIIGLLSTGNFQRTLNWEEKK